MSLVLLKYHSNMANTFCHEEKRGQKESQD